MIGLLSRNRWINILQRNPNAKRCLSNTTGGYRCTFKACNDSNGLFCKRHMKAKLCEPVLDDNSLEANAERLYNSYTKLYDDPMSKLIEVFGLNSVLSSKFWKDKYIIWKREQKDYEKEVCSICFEDCSEYPTYTTCNHVFHKNCLNAWLKRKNNCPCCRKYILENHVD